MSLESYNKIIDIVTEIPEYYCITCMNQYVCKKNGKPTDCASLKARQKLYPR